MDDRVVREQLVELLTGAQAHLSLDRAMMGLDPKLRGKGPIGSSICGTGEGG
jgi:hypothetical protein